MIKNRLELDFLPRSDVRTCVAEIDSLLTEAVSVENNEAEVFYLSTSAVKALQVELELYRGDYDEVVNKGLPLLEDAESRWTRSSYENLWADSASDDRIFSPYIFTSYYTDLCYDRESGDYFILNPSLAYSDEDVRKEWAAYIIEMNGDHVKTLGKYNRMYYDNVTVRYINTLRYSGVCFAVAEAYARDGKPEFAIATANRLLGAYGVGLLDENLAGEALVDAILHEKQKEFAGEGGRLFDLKRNGRPLERLTAFGQGVSAVIPHDDYRWLFPVPQSEYRYNDNMTQNPSWPFIKTE